MNHASLAWTVLAWLMAAAAAGFGGAWLIQQWRMAAGRAAGAALERELELLRARPPVPPPSVTETRESHWKTQAERLARAERALAEERAEWQSEALRAAAALQDSVREQQAQAERHAHELEDLRQAQQQALEHERQHHARQAAELQDAHARALSALGEQQVATVAEMQDAQSQALSALGEQHAATVAELRAEHARALSEVHAQHQAVQAEAESLRAAEHAEAGATRLAAQERELAVLRAQLGASSERVLELEQALNRLQLEALGHVRQLEDVRAAQAAALARLQAELEQAREQLQAQQQAPAAAGPQALAGVPEGLAGDGEAAPDPARARIERQRLQELEEGMARARRQAGEHRAEVAGLKGRIRDLEDRVAQLWQQEPR